MKYQQPNPLVYLFKKIIPYNLQISGNFFLVKNKSPGRSELEANTAGGRTASQARRSARAAVAHDWFDMTQDTVRHSGWYK